MASALAKGAAVRGRRVALGDGQRVLWDKRSREVFKFNPNLADPAADTDRRNWEWVHFYRGHRIYNTQGDNRWQWNYEFRVTPGEVYFEPSEVANGKRDGAGFVLIEPSVPPKTGTVNKAWPFQRYQEVSDGLLEQGVDVVQLLHRSSTAHRLEGPRKVATPDFRSALAVLLNACLYVGPEGGMHHAAAALGIPAIVIFGAWVPPAVLGYDTHINLTGGDVEACGSFNPCKHCAEALNRITADEVLDSALSRLS